MVGEYEVVNDLPRALNLVCHSADGIILSFSKKFIFNYLLENKPINQYLKELSLNKMEFCLENYDTSKLAVDQFEKNILNENLNQVRRLKLMSENNLLVVT